MRFLSFRTFDCNSDKSYSFDLELPTDCDDEYWIIAPNGEVTFQQPSDKPSNIVFFIQHLKLIEILAFVLRTIYSIKKSRVMLGLTGKDWEQKLVRDLDSALNSWTDQVRKSWYLLHYPWTHFSGTGSRSS